MKIKQLRFRDEALLIFPPLGLVLGMFIALLERGPSPHAAQQALALLLPLTWIAAVRPLAGAFGAAASGFFLGAFLCHSALEMTARDQPLEADLGRSYQLEGRLRQIRPTPYGEALSLDRITILSPAKTSFQLSRLTVYVPTSERRPALDAKITAWITLKTSHHSHPIPWPMQTLRERHMPRYYGSVKSAALWQCDRWDQTVDHGLSAGNRELMALAIQAVPATIWQERLRPFGVGHLLSISGLHCIWVYFGLQLLLWPLPRPWLRLGASLIGLLAFAHFAGWTASVTRAVLMLGLWSLLPSLGRTRSWLRLWFGVLLLALVLDPTLLLLRGFWYSFAASLGLVLGGKASSFRPSPLEHPWLRRLRPFLPIVAAQAFVIPINLMFQGYARVTDLLWNFIGVLFLAALCLLCLLAWCATQWPGLVSLANQSEGLLLRALEPFVDFSLGEWVRMPQSPLWVFLALAVLALSLRYGGRERRWYLALSSLGLFNLIGLPLSGERLVFLDVGQGLSVLHVSATGKGTLYDAGGKLPGGLRLDRLAGLFGAHQIRAAYISHRDLDHYQLLQHVPRTFPLMVAPSQREAFASDPLLAGFTLCTVAEGDRERWGSYEMTVIWPPAAEMDYPNDNEQSLVVVLENGHGAVLLTGDAGVWAEERLQIPNALASVLLQVGHHGSKTSSGSAFLERLAIRDAIISCGFRNRFFHPNADVVERLTSRGVLVWQTSETGSITMVDGEISTLE